jgi:hypothetical protein
MTKNKLELLDLLHQVWILPCNKNKSLSGFIFSLYNTHRIFFLPTNQELIEMLNAEIEKSKKKNTTEKTN